MADNVTTQSTTLATPPSGTVIATDDVAGVEYQKVKLVDGTADSTTAITGDAANGLDVDVTRVSGVVHVDDNSGSLTVDGTVTANAGTGVFHVDDNAGSLTVDGTVAATQSGTWTVQPGNTANTTAWKVDASSVAVPVTDNGGSLTVDGTVSIASTDGVSTLSPKVQTRTGDNVMFTYDPAVTRLLEEVLVELRIANVQRERMLSGTQQADYRADLKLAL